jgi:glycogen operon protein
LTFDLQKVLIDPYPRGINCSLWQRTDACNAGDNLHTSMRSCLVKLMDYDWQGDSPSNHQLNESIIYEMNVGGFTKSLGCGVKIWVPMQA